MEKKHNKPWSYGFIGFQAFSYHNPWMLFFFAYFGFFSYFKYYKTQLNI
ncbi:hypothetical protein [Anoxybacter fermentans]|nr:hypothetical protein [Anoxybacter fermentans]